MKRLRQKMILTLIILSFVLTTCSWFEPNEELEPSIDTTVTPAVASEENATPESTESEQEAVPESTESEEDVTPESTESEEETTPESTIESGMPSTAARILERGELLAAYYPDAGPFSYEENGSVVGFDIDLVREFARRWLGDENAVTFIPVTVEGRLTSLANHEVDLTASAITHKRERDESIDFSQTYYADAQRLLVRQGSEINELEDLDGKRVAGIQDTTGLAQIGPLVEKTGIKVEIIDYPNHAQAVEALLQEHISAVTSDGLILMGYANQHPELDVVGRRLSEEPYGIGVPQGDADFREFVNFTLQDMKEDGSYDQIYERWFPGGQPYPIVILPGETPYASLSALPQELITMPPSRIEQILARDKLIASYYPDAAPFSYEENGEAVGFDIEIVKEFARRWLDDAQAVEFVPVSVEGRLTSIANGDVDLTASAITHKRDRDQTVDFSQNYYADAQRLLVSEVSGMNDLKDLDGKKVGGIQDTSGLAQIAPLANAAGITIEIIDFPNHAQAVEALSKGQIDAVTSDGLILAGYAQKTPGLAVVGSALSEEPYSIGVPMNDYRLRELVNFTLQEMKRDGTYDHLYQEWFAGMSPYELQILSGDADYLLLPYVAEGLNIVPDVSTTQRIHERGDILLAGVFTDFEPFSFLDDNGQRVGFEVDLVRAIADEWGIEAAFVEVNASNQILKLETHEVDLIAANLIHSKGDEQRIDFSQTYFVDGQSLLVRADRGQMKTLQELDGATIAAVKGSPFRNQLEAYTALKGVSVTVQEFQEFSAAVGALKAGQVDALTANRAVLMRSSQEHPELVLVPEFFRLAPYGLGLPPGDSFFNNLVNFTLQNLHEKKDGSGLSRYDRIYSKWFGRLPPFNIEILPGEWPYTIATSPTFLDKPVQSMVSQLLNNCTFTAGIKHDAPPFGFLENGEEVGFDVDLVQEFAQRWCGEREAVTLVPVTSQNRIDKLVAGEIDLIAASMTHNKVRDEMIDFSQTYFLDGQTLLVHEDSDISSVADLDGKSVAAITGSTSLNNVQEEAERLDIQIEIIEFDGYPSAVTALNDKEVDTLTTDSGLLKYFAQQNEGLVVVGEPFSSEPYGIGVPNYDARFQDLVNFTLQEMKEDGTYDRIYAKWFGDEAPYPIEIWPGEMYLEMNTIPMIRIPAGDFVRGDDEGLGSEKPEQTIHLDEFYIDQYEVTTRHYDQCVKVGRCRLPRSTGSLNDPNYYGNPTYDKHPVIWVNWIDADAYCKFAGKRLPTEAEWEKAARGTEAFTYPWGNQKPTSELANFDYNHPDTRPVGSYPAGASIYGIHDMAGNVREWVADWYQHDYYQNAPSQNPSGAETALTKVIRGGSWNESFQYLATTRRRDFLPDDVDANIGFRCASSTFPPRR